MARIYSRRVQRDITVGLNVNPVIKYDTTDNRYKLLIEDYEVHLTPREVGTLIEVYNARIKRS